MFKIFNIKSGLEAEFDYAVTKKGYIIDYCGNGEYWTFIDEKKFKVIPTADLKKHNLAFTIIEPADFNYIDIYRVDDLYIAHDYNSHHDKEGVWYIIKDIKTFKEKCSNSYSFIAYGNNYMEEL